MSTNNKLILRATVTKHITEYYEFDCGDMSVDAIAEEINEAHVEDRFGWDYVHGETDHREIETKLEIVERI